MTTDWLYQIKTIAKPLPILWHRFDTGFVESCRGATVGNVM